MSLPWPETLKTSADSADNIAISERVSDRIIDVTYTTDVAFLPGIITQPITFRPTASVRLLTPPRRR